MENREHKYRAWFPAQKLMVFWEEMIKNNLYVQYFAEGAGKPELMQYTGLKDKNGKDIYKGDIVKGVVIFPQLLTWDNDKNCNFNMGGIVNYDYSGFSLKVIENLCDKERDGMVNYFDFMGGECETFDDMEIIGNVFENESLLTNK